MPATIALGHAGGTTGEWAGTLREVFGEYRAPTGVAGGVGQRGAEMADVVAKVRAMPGGPPPLLVAKPGLDGHSNGAEQVAVAARDAGFEVVYQGIRLTLSRSPPRSATRMSTWSVSRSCPAATSSWCPRSSACCGNTASTYR